MAEEWRDIPGYEGKYQASSLGRIKSVDRIITQESQPGVIQRRQWAGRILIAVGIGKYLHVSIASGAPVQYVHRLIAKTFISGDFIKADVNHKNGDTQDNRVENLEWLSRSANQFHAYRELGRSLGPKCRTVLLRNEGEVREFVSQGAAGKYCGVTAGTISSAAHDGRKCRGYEVVYA